jgi:hypothetical protein
MNAVQGEFQNGILGKARRDAPPKILSNSFATRHSRGILLLYEASFNSA